LNYEGACWGVIAEKFRVILFGRYPYALHWRPATVIGLLLALAGLTAWPRLWSAKRLLVIWAGLLTASFLLMRGGVGGLPFVPSGLWGGLALTLGLTACALAIAFPLGLALALGRRSAWAPVRSVCAAYIEIMRGVPLISVLFMSSFLLPLLLPMGWKPDVLVRVLLGLGGFAAAYIAEVIRGGLQALPEGQIMAGRALGLRPWQIQRSIVLPQALRAVVPALTNNAIGTLKDTSLITIVGLFELSGSLSLALGGDAEWRSFYLEGYLFIAALYAIFCFGLATYSRWLERQLRDGFLFLSIKSAVKTQ
jgi:general L-amino acid transport system permease protein